MNPAHDHALLLAPLIGNTPGTNLFVDNKPDLPNALVVVYNSTPFPPMRTQNLQEEDLRRPCIDIHVRGEAKDYQSLRNKAELIYSILRKRGSYVANGTLYKSCFAASDVDGPFPDEKNRLNWYLKFELMK